MKSIREHCKSLNEELLLFGLNNYIRVDGSNYTMCFVCGLSNDNKTTTTVTEYLNSDLSAYEKSFLNSGQTQHSNRLLNRRYNTIHLSNEISLMLCEDKGFIFRLCETLSRKLSGVKYPKTGLPYMRNTGEAIQEEFEEDFANQDVRNNYMLKRLYFEAKRVAGCGQKNAKTKSDKLINELKKIVKQSSCSNDMDLNAKLIKNIKDSNSSLAKALNKHRNCVEAFFGLTNTQSYKTALELANALDYSTTNDENKLRL